MCSWRVFRRRRIPSPGIEDAHMDNASDADLKQVVEDPEDAPLVEAAADLPANDDGRPSPPDTEDK